MSTIYMYMYIYIYECVCMYLFLSLFVCFVICNRDVFLPLDAAGEPMATSAALVEYLESLWESQGTAESVKLSTSSHPCFDNTVLA